MKKKMVERAYAPTVMLESTVSRAIKSARKEKSGRTLNCMVAVVFASFWLEGLANKIIYFFPDAKKKVNITNLPAKSGTTQKYQQFMITFELPTKITVTLPDGEKYVDVTEELDKIFLLRNKIAHMDIDPISYEEIIEDHMAELSEPETEFDKELKLERVEEMVEFVKELVKQLRKVIPQDDYRHHPSIFRDGYAVSISAVDDNEKS